MVVVEPATNPTLAEEDFSWPHGISPPLYEVRKRRFRKRISKRAIEDVEREVERLLQADALAEDVRYVEVHHDNKDETEFMEAIDAIDVADVDMNGRQDESYFSDGDEGEMELGEDDLVAEIENSLEDVAAMEETQNNPETFDDDTDEEDESEIESEPAADGDGGLEDDSAKLIREEIADLESKIQEKTELLHSQINPIMKTRFEGIVRKLQAELDKKRSLL
ncbi:hypothetical protein HDU96_000581 [Phlyctochytrium bullatum]|nr:hypothetical protein HDU96_000581 [Phlyctochytrium bullatum]